MSTSELSTYRSPWFDLDDDDDDDEFDDDDNDDMYQLIRDKLLEPLHIMQWDSNKKSAQGNS